MTTQNGYKMKPRKSKKNTSSAKKKTIGKNLKVSASKKAKMKKKPGGSNVGKYKNVKKSDFAGAFLSPAPTFL